MLLGASNAEQLMENIGAIQVRREPWLWLRSMGPTGTAESPAPAELFLTGTDANSVRRLSVVRQPPLRAERPELGKDAEMQGRERHEGSSGVGRGLCSQSSKNPLGTRRSEDWSLGQTLELHGCRDMGEMKPWRLVTWSRAGPS